MRRAGTRRLARYADTDVKYDVPAYRIDAIAGHSFLVLEHDTGGTGVYERGDAWYEMAPHADGFALDLPTQGHDELLALRPLTGNAHILQHDWKSEIVHRPESADDALRLNLSVKYTWYGDSGSLNELFERHQSAAFVWDAGDGELRFDRARSDLTEQEFRDVYRAEGMNADAFARYNAADVNRILEQGTPDEQRAFAALGITRARQD